MNALNTIGMLLVGIGLLMAGRTEDWKPPTLATAGALFLLGYYIVTHNEPMAWFSAVAVVCSAAAAISYYRKAQQAGGAK